ncbi:MAG: TetR/AcrR family transcriptional regulator [Myxococcota bacterium]
MGRKKEISDQELASIAREVFFEHGPQVATSVIARAAGVSQATLFNRFQNKHDLMLEAMIPPNISEILRIVQQPVYKRPIPAQLLEKAEKLFMHFKQLEPHMRFLEHAGLNVKDVLSFHARKKRTPPPPILAFQHMTQWLRDAQAEGRMGMIDAEKFAQLFIGSIHAKLFFHRLHKHFASQGSQLPEEDEISIRHHFAGTIDVLWRGIAPVTG